MDHKHTIEEMTSGGLERKSSTNISRHGRTGSFSRRAVLNMSQFEVKNKYHSQGMAAGGSALLDAINRGKVHLAKFILDAAGEDDVANTRDFKGKTPLIRACYIKEEKTRGKAVELLLDKGADVNIQDDVDRTVLSYACELRCNDVVRMLVKNNVDPDISDKQGNTALIHSAMVGNDVAIEILIRSYRRLGLQVDHVNNEGLTALLIAAKNGFIECASILALDGKACISFRDREQGLNAEEWARVQGCSTPEVLAFSTQAYRYTRPATSSRTENNGAVPSTSSAGRTHLTVSSPTHHKQQQQQQPTRDGRGRRMSQIPPRMYDVKTQPGKVKRGSLPTIKFTGLFSTKQGASREVDPEAVLKALQQKNDAAIKKMNQKGSQYTVRDGSESPRGCRSAATSSPSSSASGRAKSVGGTPKLTHQRSRGSCSSPSASDQSRSPSQSTPPSSPQVNHAKKIQIKVTSDEDNSAKLRSVRDGIQKLTTGHDNNSCASAGGGRDHHSNT